MQFGVAFRTGERSPDLGSPEVLVRLAQRAEELGYDSVWASDHVTVPAAEVARIGERWFDPLVLLASLAAHTQRIRLGTDVLVLPYRHPLMVAKAVATLDRLSGGRVILGVGTGYIEPEFRALGIPFEERGDRMDECLRVLRQVWVTPGLQSFDGQFYKFSNVHIEPGPAPASGGPHPPIWVAGGSRRVIRRAIDLGDGWQPLEMPLVELDGWLEYLRRYAAERGRREPVHVCISFRPVDIDYGGRPKRAPPPGQRKLLSGAVREAVADLEALRERGVGHLVLRFAAGDSGWRDLEQAMARFAHEVRRHAAD